MDISDGRPGYETHFNTIHLKKHMDEAHRLAREQAAEIMARITYEPVKTPDTVGTVPNKPKTPVSNFRIPEDVKEAATAKAKAEGKTLTDVVVEALRRYIKAKPRG